MTAILSLALVLVAITGRTELLNETIRVPQSQWRALKVSLTERPATVEVDFKVLAGRSGVRVLFMTNVNAERFENGRNFEVLAQTAYQAQGTFRYLVANPGEYRILLDNRLEGREPAETQVKVTLLFHSFNSFIPKTLDTARKRWVTLVSLGSFALVSMLIARKLVPELRKGA